TSSAGTKRSTSVPPWGSTSLDMTEGSWPGDGKAQPDEDECEDGPQRALRNGVRDAGPQENAGHGAGEDGSGQRDVHPARLEVAERGHRGEDEGVHEVRAHHG